MKTYDYDYIIYIGRFEPPHKGHMETTQTALRLGQKVIVLFGTANSPRTFKNPWVTTEREVMMRSSLSALDNQRVEFAGIEDRLYDNDKWLITVRQAVALIINDTFEQLGIEGEPSIAIIGHDKDESSRYIKDFPEWTTIDTGSHVKGNNQTASQPLSSTMIRQLMFTGNLGYVESNVPYGVYKFLENFITTPEFEYVKADYDHYVNEENQYKNVIPYWMNFFTGDAVVFQSSHVLMIKRKDNPGKDLWALPGGHVSPTETPYECSIRELLEEAGLKIPLGKLKGSLVLQEQFAHPDRSLRCRVTGPYGRTSTTAFCFNLDGIKSSGESVDKLPRVKGMDDAKEARWFPISKINSMRSQIFEDHADIIEFFHSRLPRTQTTSW